MRPGIQRTGNSAGRDGRNIDSSLGILSGEAAQQSISSDREPLERLHPQVFRSQPSQQLGLTTGDATYYSQPLLKKSPWSWDIPAYYYVGGATGASAALGAAATLFNPKNLPNLIRYARWIGPVGATLSAFFLIHDLGRPWRFLHMLRVFRPTSPMSVGSYILASFSTFAGIAWLANFAPASFARLGKMAGIASGILGLGLAGYTGVLVANTAVPLWRRPHRLMPVLFISSGAAAAASLLCLFDINRAEQRALTIFGTLGKLSELGASTAIERHVADVPEVARPLQDGFSGLLWKAGKVCTIASAALGLWPRASRKLRIAAGLLGTAGAICVRFGIHYAGQCSAMNPRASFHQQRKGQGAFEVTGKASVTGPGDVRAYLDSGEE